MKNYRRTLALVLTVILAVCLFALPAMAATETGGGLELTLTTDKAEYTSEENITASLTVKNTTDSAIENLVVEHVVPNGFSVVGGTSQKNIETLAAGESVTVDVVYNASNPGTGDFTIVAVAAAMVVAAAGLVTLGAADAKVRKSILSIFLCCIMVAGLAVGVNADELTDGVTVSTTAKVNGNEVTLSAKVSQKQEHTGDPDAGDVAGYENILNENAAQVQVNEAVTMPAGADMVVKAVTDVNENIVAVTMTHTADQHRLYINMTGSCSGWDGGLGLRLGHEGMMLNLGGVNATELVQLDFFSLGAVGEEFTVAYKLTYLESNGKYHGVEIEVWAGPATGALTKVGPYAIKDSRVSYDSEKGAFILKYDIVDSAEKFTPDCTVAAMGAFNGSCEFTIVKVEILADAPNAGDPDAGDVAGYENILNENAAQVLVNEPVTMPAGVTTVVEAVDNVNENYVAVTFKRNADTNRFYINMTGAVHTDAWFGGIGLTLSQNEGVYLRVGGVNEVALAQLKLFSLGPVDEEFTVVYKLTYQVEGSKYNGVEIEIWAGPANGTLTKVELYSIMDSRCTYDAEKGAYILKYDIVDSADKFIPDCTVVAKDAFNGSCEFILSKVEILNAAP